GQGGDCVDEAHATRVAIDRRDQLLDDDVEHLRAKGIEQVGDGDIVWYLVVDHVLGHELDIPAAQTVPVARDGLPGHVGQRRHEIDPDHAAERIPACDLEDNVPVAAPEVDEYVRRRH